MKRRHEDSDRSLEPPFSRLFLIGRHGQFDTKSKVQEIFEVYGTVKDVWILYDKQTGRDRGLAYIQYVKTSEAAKAMEELDGKAFLGDDKPVKVKPASDRPNPGGKEADEDVRMLKLFVKIPTEWDEAKMKEVFEQYGPVDKVKVLVDHRLNTPKGLGFVTYCKPYSAAICYENCDRSYKPLFADSRAPDHRGDRFSHDNHDDWRGDSNSRHSRRRRDDSPPRRESYGERSRHRDDDRSYSSRSSMPAVPDIPHNGPTRLVVKIYGICSSEMINRLFGLIPGMEYCDLNCDEVRCSGTAFVKYSSPQSAAMAKNKLNGFEYPFSSPMSVEYVENPGEATNPVNDSKVQEALKVLEAAGLATKAATSLPSRHEPSIGLDLPPEKPLIHVTSPCVERLFLVLERRMSDAQLFNIFCRFGDLIEVFLLPGKNHGYAKYGSKASAEAAVHALHRQEVFGCFLKVMIADPDKGPH